MHAVTVKPTSGSSTFVGAVVSVPMTASASAFATKEQMSDAVVDVPDDAPAEAVGAAEVPLLDVAAALELGAALVLGAALELVSADGDAEPAADALLRADAVAELVPKAAGDPLAPPELVVG